MKSLLFTLVILFALSLSVFAQNDTGDTTTSRKRVVITDSMPPIKPASTPVPRVSPTPIVVGSGARPFATPVQVIQNPATQTQVQKQISAPTHTMSFGQIKSHIAEARRQLQNRPIATALTEGSTPIEVVRIAFHDWKTKELDYVVMSKAAFLATDSVKSVVSEKGRRLSATTIRGNGVNTPVTLVDEDGEAQLPLLVQYPVVKGGKYTETAYYMSTHPGLVTPEVVGAGKIYVHNVIELARDRLHDSGISIEPKIADIAERLAAVEHVDHLRFKTESRKVVYDDIYTLFALNEGQTYRYSVSSAGAGGMVQMIPSTYRMVRSWHPNVQLIPDFVDGMRNHVNATQAMLLYMQRTWNDLIADPTIAGAVLDGTATQEQLMASGYNSNPARLAGYIKRGGSNWTNLIPRETQIYLQIYDSMESLVPLKSRSR